MKMFLKAFFHFLIIFIGTYTLLFLVLWLLSAPANAMLPKASCEQEVKFGILAGETALLYPNKELLNDEDQRVEFYSKFIKFVKLSGTSGYEVMNLSRRAYNVYLDVIRVYVTENVVPFGHEEEVLSIITDKLCSI